MSKIVLTDPYVDRLRADLAGIQAEFDILLDMSTILPVERDLYLIAMSKRRWAPSGTATSAAQMALLDRYGSWFDRFKLLFPNPTPDVSKKLKRADDFVRRWVARERSYDPSIPETISQAKDLAHAQLAVFEGLSDIAAHGGDTALRLVPDTNVLLRNPAPEDLGGAVGATSYTVHLLPTVLAELDELKDRGKAQDVRDKAEKAIKRLKGFRDRVN